MIGRSLNADLRKMKGTSAVSYTHLMRSLLHMAL